MSLGGRDIGDRIKKIRGKLRQDEFAKKLGVHTNTVGRWERGARDPDYIDLKKILEVFPDVMPDWLLSGEGPMKKDIQDIEPDGFYSDHKLLIAKKFRQIRGDKTIEKFCNDFHWDYSGWWAIEEDLRNPNWVLLYRICSELGINPSWLIEDKGPMLKADIYCTKINTELLRDVIMEAELHNSINPETLTPDKKAELIAELYAMRAAR